jgi:tetratricopeptide (TPR) repeat protein
MALDVCVALMATAAPLLSATLVGFLPQGHFLVLEARSDGEALLRRVSHDGATSAVLERIRSPRGRAWVEQRAHALGVRAPEALPRADGDRWHVEEMTLVLVREAPLGGRRTVKLEAQRGERALEIFRMPELGRVEIDALYPVPGTRSLVVAYQQNGRRGIEAVDLSRALAALLNLEALVHYRAGAYQPAAELWERAIATAPGEGNAIYNLACLHARLGQLHRAKSELAIALGLDRVRYRALASDDADLAPLRADPEVRAWLGLASGPKD